MQSSFASRYANAREGKFQFRLRQDSISKAQEQPEAGGGTMAGVVPLADFVTLGQQLYILMNPLNVDVVLGEIPKFRESLRKCGLHRTSIAADTLGQIAALQYFRVTGIVSDGARHQLQAMLDPITRTLYNELAEQNAISVNVGIVSQQLRQLPSKLILTATQSDLLNETVTCIECGAYRAGVVMGWNLAYDYIRQWVYDKHLTPFNDVLTTVYMRNGSQMYEPIVDYGDFLTGKLGERVFIDTCHRANFIGENLRDNLRYYLRRRNDYAHPTFTAPSADQTNGYVKDLIDTISATPFN
jgi:hypothetical protein